MKSKNSLLLFIEVSKVSLLVHYLFWMTDGICLHEVPSCCVVTSSIFRDIDVGVVLWGGSFTISWRWMHPPLNDSAILNIHSSRNYISLTIHCIYLSLLFSRDLNDELLLLPHVFCAMTSSIELLTHQPCELHRPFNQCYITMCGLHRPFNQKLFDSAQSHIVSFCAGSRLWLETSPWRVHKMVHCAAPPQCQESRPWSVHKTKLVVPCASSTLHATIHIWWLHHGIAGSSYTHWPVQRRFVRAHHHNMWLVLRRCTNFASYFVLSSRHMMLQIRLDAQNVWYTIWYNPCNISSFFTAFHMPFPICYMGV